VSGNFPNIVNIATVCPKIRKNVTLQLTSVIITKYDAPEENSKFIEGAPSACDFKSFCHSTNDAKCYLHAKRLKGRRIQRRVKRPTA
jgi:hypothetical protein